MSLFGSLTGGISDLFTGDSFEDTIDPGNFFHTGSSERNANRMAKMQYDLEKENADRNYDEQVRMNDYNIRSQEEAFQYQKDLNALQMEREDNAVSRRVADLKASGLSPTLAAGSAASATPVHAGTAPQGVAPQKENPSDVRVREAMFRSQMQKEKMALAMSMVGNMADVSQTFAQKKLIEAKATEQNIMNKFVEQMMKSKLHGMDLSNEAQEIANSWADSLNSANLEMKNMEIAKVGNQLRLMDEEIKHEKELTNLTHEQWFLAKKEAILKDLQASKLSADVSKSYLDQMATAYSLKWYQEHGLPYGSSGQYAVILSAGSKVMEYVDPVINDSVKHNKETHSGGFNLEQLKELSDKGEMPKSIFGLLFDAFLNRGY